MVAASEEALQQKIQALGDVLGEDHLPAVLSAEQAAQQLAGLVNGLFGIIGPLVTAAPVDVAAPLVRNGTWRPPRPAAWERWCWRCQGRCSAWRPLLCLAVFFSVYHFIICFSIDLEIINNCNWKRRCFLLYRLPVLGEAGRLCNHV